MKDNAFRATALRKAELFFRGYNAHTLPINIHSGLDEEELDELTLVADELEANIPEVTPQMEADWELLDGLDETEWVEPKRPSGG